MTMLSKVADLFQQEGTIPLMVIGLAPNGNMRVGFLMGMRPVFQERPDLPDKMLAAIRLAIEQVTTKPLDDLELR